jgi:hypothetical protein
MARVVERHRTRHEGEAEGDPARWDARPSGSPQRVICVALAFRLDELFGIGLVVLRCIFQPGDLVAQRILETYQCILHTRRGAGLRKAHLMLGDFQNFKHLCS